MNRVAQSQELIPDAGTLSEAPPDEAGSRAPASVGTADVGSSSLENSPSGEAAPSASTAPLGPAQPETKPVDIAGSIANTNADSVLAAKEVLKPDFGFEDLFLTKGSSAVLDTQSIPGYSFGEMVPRVTDGGIISGVAEEPGGGLRVNVGSATGTTQVLLYENLSRTPGQSEPGKLLKVYRITVTKDDLLGLMQELRALIGDVEGLDIRVVGSKVVVDGNVLVPKDMRRVLNVLDKFKDKPVLNLAEVSPLTLKLIGEKMEEEIAGGKERPKDIKIKVRNGRFFLEGAVDSNFQKAEAERICMSYLSDRYVMDAPKSAGGELTTPGDAPLGQCVSMIRKRQGQPPEPDQILSVRVDFVTLSRNYAKGFNFNWSPGFTNKGNDLTYRTDTGRFLGTFAATISNLFPKLHTASTHGYARALKSASLMVRDGVNAAAGNAPPKATLNETFTSYALVPGKDNAPATYQAIQIPTIIEIQAKSVPGTDKINLDIFAKQTSIVGQGQPGAPPATQDSSINTSIIVSGGESAALGGLISERRNVDINRNPASADTDFNIFEMGRKHQLTDDKSQFIIFVTPNRLRTPTEGTETLKRKFRLRK